MIMATWQIILVLLLIPVIGLISKIVRIKQEAKQVNLVVEFLERFVEWINGDGENYQSYNWLIAKSDVVQSIIGRFGLIHFRAPFNAYSVKNYPVILNAIPEIRKLLKDPFPIGNARSFYINTVDGCLRRYLGSQEELNRNRIKNLINPVTLFCAGIACILEIPVYLLAECKIISHSRSMGIVKGRIFSLFSGLATLATLISGIMAIVMGWEKFITVIKSIFEMDS
jgi:hypothetical protein